MDAHAGAMDWHAGLPYEDYLVLRQFCSIGVRDSNFASNRNYVQNGMVVVRVINPDRTKAFHDGYGFPKSKYISLGREGITLEEAKMVGREWARSHFFLFRFWSEVVSADQAFVFEQGFFRANYQLPDEIAQHLLNNPSPGFAARIREIHDAMP